MAVLSYSWVRPAGTRTATFTERSAIAELDAVAAPATLSAAAISAMTDPAGMTPLIDVALEIESNRLQRTTTVTLRRGDTLAAVGVWDATLMDAAQLVDARRNPTARFAVGDVSVGDDTVAWDALATGEQHPTAFATVGTVATVPYQQADGWSKRAAAGAVTAMTYGPGTGDADADGNIWSTTLAPGDRMQPATLPATGYRVPANTARPFTGAAYVWVAVGSTMTLHLRARFDVGLGTEVVVDGPPVLVTGGTTTRLAAPLTYPAQATVRTIASARLEIVCDATSTGAAVAVNMDAPQLYVGADRGSNAGIIAAVPDSGLAVAELTWADGARTVNRVEVHGERRLGRVTSARVDVQEAGAWIAGAGVAWGAGRLAVTLDREYAATGVRLYIEETTSGRAGRVWLTEVDPMLVRDLSDDVVTATVTAAAEAEPGRATLPVGNYQASTVELTLDNTDGSLFPERNAALDTGHRVEVALGVRYANVLPNPRADLNLDGWRTDTTLGTLTREGAEPRPVLRVTAGQTSAVAEHGDAVVAGQPVGVWSGVEGRTIGSAYAFRAALLADLATAAASVASLALWGLRADGTGAAIATVAAGAGAAGLTPLAVTCTHAQLAGFTRIIVRVAITGAAGDTLRVETLELNELTAAGAVVQTDELLPFGVFYTDAWNAPSDSSEASIGGADRLGRFADTPVDAAVVQNIGAGALLRDLALTYLDADDDQLAVASTLDAYVLPYAYPTGSLGTYLADIAKATMSTLFADSLDRLAVAARGNVDTDPVAEVRADNALIRARHPVALDAKVSIVQVTARPLRADPAADLWTAPDGGFVIAAGASIDVIAPYTTAPAVAAAVSAITATGAYTITRAAFYSDAAFLTIRNDAAGSITVTTLVVSGQPLTELALTARREHPPSRRRYGPRVIETEARLVQTQTQLDTVADVLLDAFRGVDDDGVRRLASIELDAMPLLHADVRKRITVVEPASGIGRDYEATTRTVTYQRDTVTMSLLAREAPDAPFAVGDVSIADDVFVAGY